MLDGYHARSDEDFLNESSEIIKRTFLETRGGSRASLDGHRFIGDLLNRAKDELRKNGGLFEAWVDAQEFPFSKLRRLSLMKLAANWDDVIEAVEALPKNKQRWSVDRALAIWTASQRSTPPARTGEADRLRRELAGALKAIKDLRGDIVDLKVSLITVKANLSAVKDDYAELTTEHEGLVADYKELLTENEGLVADCAELNTENEGLTTENEALAAAYKELVTENEGLVADFAELMNENEGLVAENEALKAEAERVQPETAPAQAQPFGRRWFRKARLIK